MKTEMWNLLGLERATLRDFEAWGDAEKQPAPLKLAYPELNEAPAGADDWRGQEPVERIVNTILLCAVRDGASLVFIEPQTRNVRVRYVVKGDTRDHIQLPTFTLKPIVARLKSLARIELEAAGQKGRIRLRVDERFYDLHISTQTTPLGERVEVRFSVVH